MNRSSRSAPANKVRPLQKLVQSIRFGRDDFLSEALTDNLPNQTKCAFNAPACACRKILRRNRDVSSLN